MSLVLFYSFLKLKLSRDMELIIISAFDTLSFGTAIVESKLKR